VTFHLIETARPLPACCNINSATSIDAQDRAARSTPTQSAPTSCAPRTRSCTRRSVRGAAGAIGMTFAPAFCFAL
jgi:hypothetical protein